MVKLWGPSGIITMTAPAGFTYALADLHAGEDGTAIASWVSAAGFTGPKPRQAKRLLYNLRLVSRRGRPRRPLFRLLLRHRCYHSFHLPILLEKLVN